MAASVSGVRSRVLAKPRPRVLRVVTLDDSETIHNAFFDRRFRKDKP